MSRKPNDSAVGIGGWLGGVWNAATTGPEGRAAFGSGINRYERFTRLIVIEAGRELGPGATTAQERGWGEGMNSWS